MLNLVAEPRGNSRLACQITLTDALNGLVVNAGGSALTPRHGLGDES